MTAWHAAEIRSSLVTRQLNTRSRSGIAPAQNWKASPMQACFSSKVSALAVAVVLKIQAARSTITSVRGIFVLAATNFCPCVGDLQSKYSAASHVARRSRIATPEFIGRRSRRMRLWLARLSDGLESARDRAFCDGLNGLRPFGSIRSRV